MGTRGKPPAKGDTIISLRGGLTQAQLAESADLPLSCVIRAERWGRLSGSVVEKLATALGVSTNTITR